MITLEQIKHVLPYINIFLKTQMVSPVSTLQGMNNMKTSTYKFVATAVRLKNAGTQFCWPAITNCFTDLCFLKTLAPLWIWQKKHNSYFLSDSFNGNFGKNCWATSSFCGQSAKLKIRLLGPSFILFLLFETKPCNALPN